MKKLFLLRESLFIAFAAATCGLFFTSCGTDVKIPSQSDKENTTTKMTRSEFHWRCPSCGLLNGGWRNYCADPRCGKEYSVPHGNLILTYLDIINILLVLQQTSPHLLILIRQNYLEEYFRPMPQNHGMKQLVL